MVAFDDSRLTQSDRRRKAQCWYSNIPETNNKLHWKRNKEERRSAGSRDREQQPVHGLATVAALFSSIRPSAPHWAFMSISCSTRRENTLLDRSNKVQEHNGEMHQAPSMSVLHIRSTDTCAQHWYQICPMMLWVLDQVQSFSNTRSKTRKTP